MAFGQQPFSGPSAHAVADTDESKNRLSFTMWQDYTVPSPDTIQGGDVYYRIYFQPLGCRTFHREAPNFVAEIKAFVAQIEKLARSEDELKLIGCLEDCFRAGPFELPD